jgi:flagellar motor switch protein FliM
VVSTFHIDLEHGGGELHLALPYSMIEPIRDLLDAGVQSDRGERDEHWEQAMREEVMEAEVELHGILAEVRLSVQDLSRLKAGDLIPLDMPDTVQVFAADIPVFHGRLGVSDGNYAVKISKWVDNRPRKDLLELPS